MLRFGHPNSILAYIKQGTNEEWKLTDFCILNCNLSLIVAYVMSHGRSMGLQK